MTILLTSALGAAWDLELDDEGWPLEAKFYFGQQVQRRDLRNGQPPTYRFKGLVCGWYRAKRDQIGYCVNSIAEPGCIQIYPEAGLEALP